MNLYARYFSHDVLATNMDEVVSFLSAINEINVDQTAINRIQTFWESNNSYPFRLKVSFSNYVLFLKTEAQTLQEFKILEQQHKAVAKSNGKAGNNQVATNSNRGTEAPQQPAVSERKRTIENLNEPQEGWYEATMYFKRVVQNPITNKCQYKDTRFKVRLKAASVMDCYNRIIDHLHNRQEIDQRSQFPSVKSNNFEYHFLGNESDFINPDNAVSDGVDGQS